MTLRKAPTSVLLGMLELLVVAGCAARVGDFASKVNSPDRPANERALDATRKPVEVLTFFGVKAGDKVADVSAGRGYYSAILSAVVGPSGLVYSVNRAPRPQNNKRWHASRFANVRVADGPFNKIALPQDSSLDFVLIHLNYHDVPPAIRGPMNQRILASLKPGGIYGVVDHSAKDGSGNKANRTLHRIDKLQVIKEVTSVGFILSKEGAMLRKPEDPRDFSVTKVRNKDDRFVLAFQKP